MADPSQQYGAGARSEHLVPIFRHRTGMYKVGLVGLGICLFLFLIGFSTPYWINQSGWNHSDDFHWLDFDDDDFHPRSDRHWGLWTAPCMSSENSCSTGLIIAQVVFCLHLIGYIVSLIVAVYENCRKVNLATYHSRRLELLVLATGIMGTAGMVAFGTWYSNTISYKGYMWSLAISSISLTALYIVFFLLLCGNRKPSLPAVGTVITQQGTGVVHYNPGNPYGPTVVQTYGPVQPGYPPPRYGPGPQTQPFLPPQGYPPYPPSGPPQGAPPAYSLPPSYPTAPQTVPGPAYGYQPVQQHEAYAKANAPPSEDVDTVPMKR